MMQKRDFLDHECEEGVSERVCKSKRLSLHVLVG